MAWRFKNPKVYGPYDPIKPGDFDNPYLTRKERELIKEVTMKMTMVVPKEIEEHLALCNWLNKNGVFFIHIPNEGQRTVQQNVLLKRMGMKKGAPDFLIPGPENIAIELKRIQVTGKSGKKVTPSRVSEAQKQCLGVLEGLGWTTFVAYGAAEAIKFLKDRELVKVPLKKVNAVMQWGDKKVKVPTPYVAKGRLQNTKLAEE